MTIDKALPSQQSSAVFRSVQCSSVGSACLVLVWYWFGIGLTCFRIGVVWLGVGLISNIAHYCQYFFSEPLVKQRL